MVESPRGTRSRAEDAAGDRFSGVPRSTRANLVKLNASGSRKRSSHRRPNGNARLESRDREESQWNRESHGKEENQPAATASTSASRSATRPRSARSSSLADDVAKSAFKGGDIAIGHPHAHALQHALEQENAASSQMGDAKAKRELFNLNQAKQFMQTCCTATRSRS